ncbi:UNVERIFIED_ORG: hypothetical protein J2W74_003441 [Methylorubrum zatmanii]
MKRELDGMIGPTLHEQMITAPTIHEAVASALRIEIDIDIERLGGNALYLVDNAERPLWSLHAPSGPPDEQE